MEMDVMMIGFTRAGKTSYMAAMYELFNRTGVEGFAIQACDRDDHNSFVRIGKALRNGVFPRGTDILQKYSFMLHYGGKGILAFNWTDYRGGILAEKSTSRDMDEVVQQVINSNALLIFLDSMDFVNLSEREMRSILRRVSTLIQNVASRLSASDSLPVSIILTKADAPGDFKDVLTSSGFSELQNIIEGIAKNKNINGLLTATVVGENVLNIEYPFLMSMTFGLLRKRAKLVSAFEDKRDEANRTAAKGGLLDNIVSVFTGDPTWTDIANSQIAEANALVDEINALSEPLERVLTHIQEVARDEDNFLFLF